MSKVRVAAFSVSLDGYGAGRELSLEAPLGRGGEALLAGVDLPALGFDVARHAASENAMHVVMTKRRARSA
jgi:hypothetical protein